MIDVNKICYLFDVDGTLTEPRKVATETFVNEFVTWANNKQLFIGTGSDFDKTKQQLPQEVINCFKKIYCCMGNESRSPSGIITSKINFKHSIELEDDLEKYLNNSAYDVKTGRHLEYRTGMVNFSVVGRNANHDQRIAYNKWDNVEKERELLVSFINNKFNEYEASVGGSISIDIIMKGHDKGQIITDLINLGVKKLVFVGDKCMPGGNDYGIIRELSKSSLAYEWYQVSGPDQTLSIIKNNKVFL